MKRSDEREQFYADVITGAVEGGTGYWAQVSQYQYRNDDGTISVCVGERTGNLARCVLHDMEEPDSGPIVITTDDVARAFRVLDRLIVDPEPPRFGQGKQLLTPEGKPAYLSVKRRTHLLGALRELEAGMIDADDADVIVQLAAFGKVVYG